MKLDDWACVQPIMPMGHLVDISKYDFYSTLSSSQRPRLSHLTSGFCSSVRIMFCRRRRTNVWASLVFVAAPISSRGRVLHRPSRNPTR